MAAPYASSRLADAGARVIKLERHEGDFARRYDTCVHGESAYFVWLNRGKESVRFDFKDDGDQALLRRMLGRADVFIQNLVPGAAARAGFASEDLRAEFPRLITCDISGYGEEGPFRDKKAYDLLVQAESGLAFVTGTPDSPGRVGVSVCDIAAGMYAHQAILQALFARERTGENRGVQVSLYGAMADWMNVPYLQHHYGGKTPGRAGLNHPSIAPYGAYECGDGKAVLISIQNEREWRSLCESLLGGAKIADDERFATNPDRVANRPALDAVINAAFGAAPREAITSKLDAAKVAWGRLSSLDDLTAHPQNRFIEVKSGDNEVKVMAPPAIAVGETERYGPVPALGEHDAAVRAEFGE